MSNFSTFTLNNLFYYFFFYIFFRLSFFNFQTPFYKTFKKSVFFHFLFKHFDFKFPVLCNINFDSHFDLKLHSRFDSNFLVFGPKTSKVIPTINWPTFLHFRSLSVSVTEFHLHPESLPFQYCELHPEFRTF